MPSVLKILLIAISVAGGLSLIWFLANRYTGQVLALDRRIIYAIVFVLVLVPLVRPLSLPISVTTETRRAFDLVESMPAGTPIVIGVDFGPSTAPECLPVLVALLHQCFRNGLKPILVSLVPDGRGMAVRGLSMVTEAVDPEGEKLYPTLRYGEDYAFLGYKTGSSAVIIGVGQSFHTTFPVDYNNTPTGQLPLMQRVRKLGDCGMIFDIASVGVPEFWLMYGSERYHLPLAVSCTAVSAVQYYPYYSADQFVGLVNGMKGAAEYEQLVELPGSATAGMDAQTSVHLFIVFAIILANTALFVQRRRVIGGLL